MYDTATPRCPGATTCDASICACNQRHNPIKIVEGLKAPSPKRSHALHIVDINLCFLPLYIKLEVAELRLLLFCPRGDVDNVTIVRASGGNRKKGIGVYFALILLLFVGPEFGVKTSFKFRLKPVKYLEEIHVQHKHAFDQSRRFVAPLPQSPFCSFPCACEEGAWVVCRTKLSEICANGNAGTIETLETKGCAF